MDREDAGDIGPGAEERRMAEGDDPRIAEREVERQGEEDHDEDLSAERKVFGKDEIGGDRADPGYELKTAQMVPRKHRIGDRAARRRRDDHAARPNRPCGRQSRIASVAA